MIKFRTALLCLIVLAILIFGWRIGVDTSSTSTNMDSPAADNESAGQSLSKRNIGNGMENPPDSVVVSINRQPLQPVTVNPKWTVLEERMRWDSEGLELTTHPDGHISIDLGGRYTHMSAGVRDSSGRLIVQCFTNYRDLKGALTGAANAPGIPTDPIEYEVSDY